MKKNEMIRYSVIHEKNPREIVLLRGNGCKWKKCRFCDYYLDADHDENANFILNKEILEKVTGVYGVLEVTNSGSFTDLNEDTLNEIETVCKAAKIHTMHIESHWLHRQAVSGFKARFQQSGIDVKFKIGVETFDIPMREDYFYKGMGAVMPAEIAAYFQEVCLLQGVEGQTVQSMKNDIETGLLWFERVCVNIMQENGMPVRPSSKVRALFLESIYPTYIENDRVDILVNNTDFGVGGES